MTDSIKLHSFLAHAGVASRRTSEKLIADGFVTVNGTVTNNVATRIRPEKDVVAVRGKKISSIQVPYVYYILNKPVGYVSTARDPDGRRTVMSLVPSSPRVYPVGRLDIDTEGLLILTNDGDLAYRMTHAKFEMQKTYRVLIQGAPGNTALNAMRAGVLLKEGVTGPTEIEIEQHDHGNTWIRITIHEGGRNRQVRRMCAQFDLQILRLIRVSHGPFSLNELRPGTWRLATKTEVATVGTPK
ncbi:MAG TPA: pseudouridine synthase [Patescibacteria group bacterium]|nr:pseudouridine synthase [Patescibacteria group bacterium]